MVSKTEGLYFFNKRNVTSAATIPVVNNNVTGKGNAIPNKLKSNPIKVFSNSYLDIFSKGGKVAIRQYIMKRTISKAYTAVQIIGSMRCNLLLRAKNSKPQNNKNK